MDAKKLTVVSRSSELALRQVEEALLHLRPLLSDTCEIESHALTTPGDRDLKTSLTDDSIPDDFFTRDLDETLLNGSADISIHSAKDLPEAMPEGLCVAALLPAKDIRDTLVLRAGIEADKENLAIGTSSPRREEQIKKLYPNSTLNPIRGTISQRLEQLDNGQYDGVIIAACALLRLGLEARISRHLPYDPTPQQGRLAMVIREDNEELKQVISQIDIRRHAGMVALAGCPADTSLMPEKIKSYIRQADLIYHDRLIPDDVLISVREKAVPVGKAGGQESTRQSEIHRQMLEAVEQGKLVLRLQGGDPCLFGHLLEELDFLASWGIRTDTITAPTAAQILSAHAPAPLTHRGDGGQVTIISGHRPKGKPREEFPGPDAGNLAIYMGAGALPEIHEGLLSSGWPPDTPVTIGSRLGFRDEEITKTTLDQTTEAQPQKPAVILAGCKSTPFQGWTLFVGTDPEAFLKHGPILHWPLIKLVPKPLEDRCTALRGTLENVDGVIFPSRYAVRAFFQALMEIGDTRLLAGKRLLAIGPTTASELHHYGVKPDAGAENFGGVGALARHITSDLKGRYLYPCSDASPKEDRVKALKQSGIELQPVEFYMNRRMPYTAFPKLPVRRVLFTSTSTVNAYFELYPEERDASRTWLAVGPSTQHALKSIGLDSDVIDS